MKTTTVYHGTKAQFDSFNTDYVFFTTNKQMAQSYGNILIEKEIDFSGIIEIDAKGDHWRGIRLGEDFAKEIYADMVAKDFVYYSMDDLTKDRFPTDSVVSFAKELGKDFIKICNVVDYGSEVSNPIPCDVYVIINKALKLKTMTHYWTKQCTECLGAGETSYQVDEMRNGDEWHGREICTCQQCDGEGEIKQEMDDLSEEQMELMDLGFERDETTHTRFELFIGDCEIRVDFNKDASKVSQFRLNDVLLNMYMPELIERVKSLYYGITGEELTTKN